MNNQENNTWSGYKGCWISYQKSFKRSSGLMMSTVCVCEKESIVSTEDLILNLISFYLQLCTLNTKAHSFAIRLSFPSWATQASLEQNTWPSSPKIHSSPSFLSYISQHSQAINKDRWRGKERHSFPWNLFGQKDFAAGSNGSMITILLLKTFELLHLSKASWCVRHFSTILVLPWSWPRSCWNTNSFWQEPCKLTPDNYLWNFPKDRLQPWQILYTSGKAQRRQLFIL